MGKPVYLMVNKCKRMHSYYFVKSKKPLRIVVKLVIKKRKVEKQKPITRLKPVSEIIGLTIAYHDFNPALSDGKKQVKKGSQGLGFLGIKNWNNTVYGKETFTFVRPCRLWVEVFLENAKRVLMEDNKRALLNSKDTGSNDTSSDDTGSDDFSGTD